MGEKSGANAFRVDFSPPAGEKFVRFAGANHALSRTGSPRQRVERFRIILDWFGRKLGAL